MASRAQSEVDWRLEADWTLPPELQPKADRDFEIAPPSEPLADWSAYAATYDLLLEHNPAYQQLLEEFESFLAGVEAPGVIYDLGGGTGNYAQLAARRFPDSAIYFVEPDLGMSRRAYEKLAGHDNLAFIASPFQALAAPEPADLVICAHALYTMPDPQTRLVEMRRLLRPGGTLFLIDLGRPLDIGDWRSYLFGHLKQTLGIARALQILWRGREIAKQNKAIYQAQRDGRYWTHSSSEIASAVAQAGLEVISQKTVYRGYSDLLVCRAAE